MSITNKSKNEKIIFYGQFSFGILTAPQLITCNWWFNLNNIQRITLIVFILLYWTSCILTTVLVCKDQFYAIRIQLVRSFHGQNTVIKFPYHLSIIFEKGFFHEKIREVFPSTNLTTSSQSLINHLKTGRSLFNLCNDLSYRGKPCESVALIMITFGLLLFYSHCFSFILFRAFTILFIILGAFFISASVGMIYAAGYEYMYCLDIMMSNRDGRNGYYVGRHWNTSFLDNNDISVILDINRYALLIPLIIVGLYLILFQRKNL